jgi:hypothetical protein
MGEPPMLVVVDFVHNLEIGQVHSCPSDHEPIERLM